MRRIFVDKPTFEGKGHFMPLNIAEFRSFDGVEATKEPDS
jgi:hypothetical protein